MLSKSTCTFVPRSGGQLSSSPREIAMKLSQVSIGVLAAGFLSTGALAESNAAADQERNLDQQQRIEQGLKSGALTTKEAGKLEREQQHIDHMEAKDLKNGSINPAEQARLNAAENKASRDIYKEKHDAATGNPQSASSQRMQADVQRNVNQQQRISNGIQSGALTHREVGSLERGQAHLDRKEANAAANGHVGAAEQANVQASENRQSRRIYRKKHNARTQ